MRILYFGTPEFAQAILASLADSEFGAEIVGVVTREDKPKNRGHKLTPPPVKVEAEVRGYPVFQPNTLKEDVFGETFRSLAPDLCIVAAYGKILPHYVLSEPKFGAINVHGSLLPAYRGAAPIQRAIMAGEKQIGITIMQMDDGLDTGDMLCRAALDEEFSRTACGGEIEAALAEKGAAALLDVMRALGTEKYPPEKQNGSLSSYAAKITAEDRAVDFSQSVKTCFDRIRALSPDILSVAKLDGMNVKIVSAKISGAEKNGTPGTVCSLNAKGDGEINVNCADGVLTILRLVPEGKGAMSAGDFIRGRKINENSIFEKINVGGN